MRLRGSRGPRRGPLWLAVVIVALAGGLPVRSVRAEDQADEAQFHFVRGNQFYRQGRFDDALAAYYTSQRLVRNRNVAFNIARCLEQLHLYDEAFRAWSVLEREEQRESERAAIKAAIERLKPHVALVTVTTEPPGAEVFVSRRDLGAVGNTPVRLALPEGRITLLLDAAGYHAREVVVDVARGREVQVTEALERIYGTLVLRGLPPGVAVEVRRDFIDGEIVSAPEASAIGVRSFRSLPGRQVVFVSAPGFQTQRLDVDVRPSGETPVDVLLTRVQPPVGVLVIRASLDGALIKVDGREMGFSPAVLEDVPAGRRAVEISKEGRETFRTTIEVPKGERVYLEVKLRKAAVEVTAATKNLSRAEEAPASVTIITADEIAAFGWLTLSEALAGVRGVSSSNDRTYESVGFRGFAPPGDYTNRVLVLRDGHPINDITTGQGYVGHEVDVDLSNVERIEVVRGPGSVLYGTGALFGVINVVTRSPDAPGAHAEAVGHAGALGLRAGRATVAGGGSNGGIRVSGAALGQVGQRRYEWPDGETVGVRADRETAAHADLSARLGPVTLRASYNDRKKNVPTGSFNTAPVPGTTYRDKRAMAELRVDQELRGFVVSGRAASDLSWFEGDYRQRTPVVGDYELTMDRFRSHWETGELRLRTPRFWGQQLTMGGEVQTQHVDLGDTSLEAQRTGNGENELVTSAYAVDDAVLAPRLRVNLGVRADHYENSFGWTVNPRLAVILHAYSGSTTKLLAGRAFRAPSIYERFYNDGGDSQVQAVSLVPETILSAELEHTHVVNEDLQVVVAGVANEVSHLIVLDPAQSGQPVSESALQFRNVDERIRGFGAEGELRYEPGGGARLVCAYAWQRVRAGASDTEAGFFPAAPEHVVSVRGTWAVLQDRAQLLRVGGELVYDMGRRTREGLRLDDAFVTNVVVSGAYHPLRLTYYAGVFNLFDVHSFEAGYPAGRELPFATVPRLGRNGRVGLAFVF